MASLWLCASTTLEISHFQPVQCAGRNPISPKVFHRLSKSLLHIEDVEGGIWVESFRFGGILLFQWQGENFGHRKHLKFSTFNLLQSSIKNPATMLYLQRYSTDFRKRCFSSKILRIGIWVESFSCADILLLQWQGDDFAHRQHFKFPTFDLYTVPAKILYLQRYSTNFRNLCLGSKIVRVGSWGESFRCTGILLLKWQGENFVHRQHLKFSTFNLYNGPPKILYLQRYSNDFRNLYLNWKMLRVGICA